MRIVKVDWIDSTSLMGGVWRDKEEVEGLTPHECQSVGFVVAEDKERVVLVAGLSQHQYSGDICIPRACITKITELGPKRAAKSDMLRG